MITTTQPWQRRDSLLLTALLAFAALWIALNVHWSWAPIEDAAMLLRYAQNLAAGHGIRWSVNQPPVDGATDILYMALIAAFSRIAHLDVVTASRWVNIFAQIASVALLYTGARRFGGSRWLSTAATLYLIAGPATGYINSCFGAPVFAFFLLACWSACLYYVHESPTWTTAFTMALLGLLAGLTRPEGVLIAALLLIATLYLAKGKQLRITPLLVSFVLVFGILGGAYFAWRWQYFGYPLPNPFYIKGAGHLYPNSVLHAAINLATLLLPVLPLVPLGWLRTETRRLSTALVIILIPFTGMWLLLLNTNNHLARFQYAVVPLVLMSCTALGAPHLASEMWVGLQRRLPLRFAAVLAILASMFYISRSAIYLNTAWGMRTFAQRLQPFAARGYTMAITEAGALPLYSEWNAIDGLGLNDTYIAHHHLQLDAAYLDRSHPELIMVHIDRELPSEYLPGGLAQPPHDGGAAYNNEFLNFYAATHGYTLAAVWGADQCNLHLYWLRPNFPDYAAVLSAIRDHPYNFLDNTYLSHDYRNDLDSLQPCAAREIPEGQ